MKVKVFKVDPNLTKLSEKAINEWLESEGPINILNSYSVGESLVLMYAKDFSKNLRRLDGEEPQCPKCNSIMKVRSASKTGDLFWGCRNYPDCKGTQPLTDMDWEKLAGPGVLAPVKSGVGVGDNEDIPF